MMTIFGVPETRAWDPDSRRGEQSFSRPSLRRRDMWFFFGILAFMVLLFFVWQQHRGMRLADEVARLEARKEAVGTRLVEMGVDVTRLRQPDLLLSKQLAVERAESELEGRIFVSAQASDRTRDRTGGQDRWLASVGLEVPQVLAADRP